MKRKLFQIVFTLASNANFRGFADGTIYQGKLKQFCVPGLNCHSCPGALAACPMGALQNTLTVPGRRFGFYVVGLLAAFGVAMGRRVCGWLCPFGLLQELLHWPAKRFLKFRLPRAPFFFRYTKIFVLLLFVVLLPVLLTDGFGYGAPYFCELICPAGTIMAAAPLLLVNESLRTLAGSLLALKIAVASFIVAASAISHRFFCKYLCPLGAIYGLFNHIALQRLVYMKNNCNNCGTCAGVCSMGADPRVPRHRMECILCGECAKTCAHAALFIQTPFRAKEESNDVTGIGL